MCIECDYSRLHLVSFSLINNLINQELMTAMYPIKEAYSSNKGWQGWYFSLFNIYCSQSLLYTDFKLNAYRILSNSLTRKGVICPIMSRIQRSGTAEQTCLTDMQSYFKRAIKSLSDYSKCVKSLIFLSCCFYLFIIFHYLCSRIKKPGLVAQLVRATDS